MAAAEIVSGGESYDGKTGLPHLYHPEDFRDLEIQLKRIYVASLGSGAFGSVHRARSLIPVWLQPCCRVAEASDCLVYFITLILTQVR